MDSFSENRETFEQPQRQLALVYRLLHSGLPSLFRLPGHVEAAFRRNICLLANGFLRSSIYGLIVLYLLVVSPVMLFSDEIEKTVWFGWAVLPIGIVLAGLWIFTQLHHQELYVEHVLGVSVWICLSGTLYGALRLGDSFLGYVAGFESVYIVIIAFSVLRIRLVVAFIACACSLAMALALANMTSVIVDWVSVNLFFTAPLLVGLVNGYIQESTGRHDFLLSAYLQGQTELLREVMLAGDRGEDEERCLEIALKAIGQNMNWRGVAVVSRRDGLDWEKDSAWLAAPVTRDFQPDFWHLACVQQLAVEASEKRGVMSCALPSSPQIEGFCLAVPISIDDERSSVLLCWSEVDTFSDREFITFMTQLSDHIGRFLDRIRQKQKLERMALTDSLTGLLNRSAFMEKLEDAVSRFRSDKQLSICVLFMDLDRFKWVNDNLGHQAGDRLLKIFSERLRSSFREDDVIARLGGDEFAIVLEGLGAHDVLALVERVRATYSEPVSIGEESVHVIASVGISFVAPRHHDADTVLGEADAAMYAAKNEKIGSCRIYDDRFFEGSASLPGVAPL